jgi:putative NIF3 family GTP cyclohydrolase 1 type 2
MRSLVSVVDALDSLFGIRSSSPDPAFSRFVPMAYDPAGTDWQARFEPDFCRRFNGLMLRSVFDVKRVFLLVFPAQDVLERVLAQSGPGDLVFTHHPLDMRCGDPRGAWGLGFLPIPVAQLEALKEREVSFYSCHAPMDTNRQIGTTAALVEAMGGRYVGGFYPYGSGFAGAVCDIDPLSSCELAEKYRNLLGTPYLHEEGPRRQRVERVAIIPGCGDHVPSIKAAAEMGAQAYLTGEVHCHIDNDYGRARMAEMRAYIAETPMTLLGGSHAASEFLVMRTQMAPWFERELGLETVLVPQSPWWR